VAIFVLAMIARATSVLPVPVGMMIWPRPPACSQAAAASVWYERSFGSDTSGQNTASGFITASRKRAPHRRLSARERLA